MSPRIHATARVSCLSQHVSCWLDSNVANMRFLVINPAPLNVRGEVEGASPPLLPLNPGVVQICLVILLGFSLYLFAEA